MKGKTRITTFALLAIFVLGSGTVLAQRPNRNAKQGKRFNKTQFSQPHAQAGYLWAEKLDLTDEQKEELLAIRVDNQKEMRFEMNQLREKQAHLNTLLSAPERDQKAIDETIDQISSAKGELWKKKLNHQEEMKSILTDEQVQQAESLQAMRGFRGKMQGQRGGMMKQGKGFGQGTGFGPDPDCPNQDHTGRGWR